MLHFSFGIPRGQDGGNGVQSPTSEVSAVKLANAIGGTSKKRNTVGTLDGPMAEPDDEALRQKMRELILTLRR